MLATSRYLVKRVPTVLQQYRTAATASTPTRRTWTAYKKPSPSAPAATPPPPPVPEQEEAFTPLPELEPPSSVEPLPSTSTSTSTSTNNNRTSLDLSPPAASTSSSTLSSAPLPTLSTQLAPSYPTPTPTPTPTQQQEIDWSTSFHGISSQPFSSQQAQTLMRPLLPNEIEIKPDGLLYLPEILYRRILNQAFGPGGWGMVPRGEMTVMKGLVTREWGLVAAGRLISLSRGEQTYFDPSGLPTATEGCKSNALMRCCKDLGIASELWDPAFIRTFKAQHCVEAWTEHGSTKKKQKRWRKKGNKFEYPLKEAS